MKTNKRLIRWLYCAGSALCFSSCTTLPDGTTRQSVDPIAYQAALAALAEYQRQHPVVTPEK